MDSPSARVRTKTKDENTSDLIRTPKRDDKLDKMLNSKFDNYPSISPLKSSDSRSNFLKPSLLV